jgi:hypothetical protein
VVRGLVKNLPRPLKQTRTKEAVKQQVRGLLWSKKILPTGLVFSGLCGRIFPVESKAPEKGAAKNSAAGFAFGACAYQEVRWCGFFLTKQ